MPEQHFAHIRVDFQAESATFFALVSEATVPNRPATVFSPQPL